MNHLWLFFLVLYVTPFLLAFIHSKLLRSASSAVLYYRYFVFFNMIVIALIVSMRLLFSTGQTIEVSGWFYGAMMEQYSFALLSLVVLAVATLFLKGSIKYAPAIAWITFLLLSAVLRVNEIHHHQAFATSVMYAHLVGDLLIALTMMFLAVRSAISERKLCFTYVS